MHIWEKIYRKIYHILHIHKNEKQESSIESNISNPTNEKLKSIQMFDMIYAKRIDKLEPSKVIETGHEKGPFLVLKNTGSKLLCAMGTSNCERNLERLMIDYKNYDGFTKPTCFYLNDLFEIDSESYIKFLDTLNREDQHILQKKINLLAANSSFWKEYIQNIDLEIGDLFKSKKSVYLVYQIQNNQITAFQLLTAFPNPYKIISNQQTKYYLYFDKKIEIENTKDLKMIDFVSKEVYQLICLKYQKFLSQERINKTIHRGSMIKYDDKYIYIYAQEANIYLGYPVEKRKNQEFSILIEQTKYAADFNQTYRINKEESFEILATASEEEADYNRKVKKSYHKTLKNQLEKKKPKPLEKGNIKEGVIVTDKTMMHTQYIVLERETNHVFAILLENNEIYFDYLDINQIDYNRSLADKEFKEILIHIRNNYNNYYNFIEESKLLSMIEKHSKK